MNHLLLERRSSAKLITTAFAGKNSYNNFITLRTMLNSLAGVIVFFLLSVGISTAQTTLINPTGDGGFENGSTFAANGWTVVNHGTGTNNDWFVGSVPVSFAGTNAAYVSNNGGTSYQYSPTVSSTSHFYRDVTIPAGENFIYLKFQWKGSGESGWDRLLVYTATNTVVPVAGNPASSTTTLTGATLVYTQANNAQAGYIGASVALPSNLAGTTVRLIFTWQNDGSLGTSPGVAVDNISLTSNTVPTSITATAKGGLWSSAETWVGGSVPGAGENVTIPSSAIVTVDQVVGVQDLTIAGVLQWNATNPSASVNVLNVGGNLLIQSGGKLHPYSTLRVGATINVTGNFQNDGYANLALVGDLALRGTNSSLTGNGFFEGNGVSGYVASLTFNNNGSNSINTTQNLVATVAHSLVGTSTLNTNGKLSIDNTAVLFGRPINTQVTNVAVTNMGSGYTAAPIVSCAGATLWTANAVLAIGNIRVTATDIYLCTTGGTTGATAPTHTTGTAADGTAVLMWVGSAGTIGTPFISTAPVIGTQYFYGGNLYTAISTTAAGTTPPTHTSGAVGSFLYAGSAATLSANWDATTGTVRSLNIQNPGSGYSSAPTISIVANTAGTGAVAAAVVIQSQSTATYFVVQKSNDATVSGGININSDQGVGAISSNPQASSGVGAVFCTNGGVNYTTAPPLAFSGPTALNLVTNAGSGYTTAPTIAIAGGTQPFGQTAYLPADFTITVNQGKVVSVYLTNATKAYNTPPTLTLTGGGGTGATIAFPANCWPVGTTNIGSNGQILSCTITNPGFGYVAPPVVAVGSSSGAAGAGVFTTVASGFTARIAAYYLICNYFTPSLAPGTQQDDAYIPASRKMHALWLNGNANGAKLTGNLTLISGGTGTAASITTSPVPIRLIGSNSTTATSGQVGNVLDMGGNHLLFTWNGYAGATSTYGTTKAYLRNGSMTLTGRGGGTTGSTFNYPFVGNATTGGVTVFTGTGTAFVTGSDLLTVKITETSAPTNTTTGGDAAAVGSRSFKLEGKTVGAVSGVAGTNPTFKMPLASIADNLPATMTQANTFLAQGTSQTGSWTKRSAAYGVTGALPANGQLTSPTIAPGPVTLADGSHYAWSSNIPTVTNINNLVLCANSGAFTLTGTSFEGVSGVSIGGAAVSSFTVVSGTQIDGFAGAAATGVVTVTGLGGVTASGTQTVTVNASPVAPTATPTSQTVLFGNQASLGVTGAGGTLNWYNQANGGTILSSGATYSPTPCATTTYYVAENNGSCEGNRVAIPVTVTMPTISISTPYFCGTGGNDTLTANNISSGATIAWTALTSGSTLSTTNSSPTIASLSTTSNFQLAVSVTGCPTYNVFTSVGVYPLPNANLTATPNQLCPGGSSLINTGLSSGNFSVQCITHGWRTAPVNAGVLAANGVKTTPPGGQADASLDDGKWGGVPIGFNFNYFGTTFTTCNVGTNGVLNFGPYASFNGTQYQFPNGFPSPASPLNTIGALATDFYLVATGTVKYWTEGYAPNRVFVLEYENCPGWTTDGLHSVQCHLFETIGTVEIHVKQATGVGTFAGTKTIGLQNGNGTIGAIAPVCGSNPPTFWNALNATIQQTSPQAWRFTPPANYTTTWFENGVQFASGTNIFTQTVTPTVTPPASTTYSISYTNQTTGCTNAPGSAQVQMNVLSTAPPVGLTSASTETLVCIGENFSLNTSYTGLTTGLTFQWQGSTDGGLTWNNVPSAATPSVTTSQSVTTQYRCEITSCGGTAGYSSSITVNIQTPPTVSATTNAPVYCAPGGPAVDITTTGNAVTYVFNPSAGLSVPSGTLVAATPSATTTYTITATDAIGCTNTTTITVTKAESVSFTSATASPDTLCSGLNSTLQASAAAASSTYCQPTTSCTFPDIITNVTFSSILNNTSCDGATTGGFTLFSAPNPTITAGTSLPLSVSTGGDIEGAAVWIDFNKNGTYDANELVLNGLAGTNPATYTGTVNIPATAVNGVTRMRVRCVYNTDPSVGGPCANATFGETEDYLITIVGGVDPLAYAWSPSTFLSVTNTASVTATAMNASTNYIVTATSAAGCSATDTVNVIVNPTPVTPTVTNTVICSGFNTTLSTNGANSTGWYDAPTGGNYLGNGNTYTTPVLSSSVSYYVQDSSSLGCISSRAQVDVTVNPTPIVNLGADTTRCGGTVTIDAQNAGASYAWSNGQTGQTITVSTSGTYDVLVTNAFNCIDQDTINVTINAIPVVNLGADSSYCANTFTLDAQNPGMTYLWNTNQNTQTISVTTSGSYNVLVTSPENCSSSDSITLTITPTPVVNLGNDSSLCGGNLILDAQNTGSTYLWNDGTTSSIQFVTTSGTFWVDVTNPQNCTTRDSIIIAINTPPSANLGIDQTICAGDSVVLDPGATTGATYTWNNNSTGQTLTATSTGTYFVDVVTGPNCSAVDTVVVTVNTLPVTSLSLGTSSACASATSVALTGENPAGGTFSGVGVTGSNFDATASTANFEVITYSFTDANGCTGSASDTINLIAGPSVSLNLVTDTACVNDGPVTLSGETPAGGVYSGTSVTGNVFDPLVGPGTYQINYTVTDAVTGCSSTASQNFVVDICTDVDAIGLNALQIYPNPNKGTFFIDNFTVAGKVIAEVYTLQGKLITREQLNANSRNMINVNDLSNGLYMLRLISDNQVRSVKITVSK